MFPVAILAGGLATRLGFTADRIPKSLIDINDEPFIIHQLNLLRDQKIGRVIICIGHLGDMISELLGDGRNYGLQIEYSSDSAELLGTAGALKKAIPLLGETFFVLYGDSYLNCDYQAVQETFEDSRKLALMTVLRNENRWDASNVEYCNKKIIQYDKKRCKPSMAHIDYGLGVFKRAAFENVQRDEPSDLATLYQHLIIKGELAAFEVVERFYEIGSIEGIEETRRYLSRRQPKRG